MSLTVGVLMQACGTRSSSRSLVRARMASATAALVTCVQPSDSVPTAMSWISEIMELASPADIVPRSHHRGLLALERQDIVSMKNNFWLMTYCEQEKILNISLFSNNVILFGTIN